MKHIIVATIVLLFAFAINAEANTNSKHKSKCVPLKCLAQHGPKVRISVHRNCEDKRVSKCYHRKRCCEVSKRCLLNHFCKTTKKKCYWSGAAYKVGNCAVRRKVCRRVNKRTHKVIIIRKRLHHKHRHHGKHHRRHHKRHHGKHHRRHHKKHHGKHHKRHHKKHHGKHHKRHHGKHHKRHHKKHHGKHHKRHHKKHHGKHHKRHHKRHHGKHHKRHHKKHHGKHHHHKKHKIHLKHKKKEKKVKKVIKKRKEHLKKLKEKRHKKDKEVELKKNQITCELFADPHVHGFTANFDAQTEGDWVLYRGFKLAAHYRGKRFGSWVGPIKFGVRLYHHRIYTTDFTFNTLKVDGKIVQINNGVTKLGKKSTVTRNNNKLTFSTGEGEDLDLVSFGWFFNAYVRSRAKKVSGICSKEFIRSTFFNHPQVVKDKHIKLPKCPKRKHFIRRCKKLAHIKTKFGLRSCVLDLCAGLPRKIEKRIIKRNHHEKKKKVIIDKHIVKDLRVKRITCELYADPHVKGFNRKYFNAQTVGDWVLYRGRNLSAHYRGKSFGVWVGPIKFGVRLYHYRIFSIGFNFDKVRINGKERKLLDGVNKLKHGGLIIKNGNKITFSTNDGEEVDWVSYGSFFNAYVRSNIPKISGLCSEQFVHSHFFKHYHKGHRKHFGKVKCHHKKRKVAVCKRRGLTGDKLRFCVQDLCNHLPKKIEDRILKRNHKEKVKRAKPIRTEKVVHRITCELYADPHVHGFNNQYYNAQTVGDWVLYRGKHLSAHYRGKSFGSWVGPVKFGVKLGHHRIYSVGFTFNQLKIDGEVRNIPQGTTQLGKGKITVVGNKITFSRRNEAVDFVSYGSFFNAYVRSGVEKVSGLCSQQFVHSHFFNHPHKAHRVEVEHRHCKRREEHHASCVRRGLRGIAVDFCVADLCNHLPKKIEDRIIKRNHKEIHVDPPRKHVTHDQCWMQADPHVHDLFGKNFEAQVEGDWVEYDGLHLSVHYRGKSMPRMVPTYAWVGQVEWGAYVYGQRIASRGEDVSLVNIDGSDVRLKQGKNALPKGGWINVAGNKITISTNDGEEVDFVAGNWQGKTYFNSYVRSDVEKVSGICAGQFVKSGFFSNSVEGKIDHIHERLCARREHFEGECRRTGLAGANLINCIFDLCAGMKLRQENKIVDLRRHEKRKELPKEHKQWFQQVVKQIGREFKPVENKARFIAPVFHARR